MAGNLKTLLEAAMKNRPEPRRVGAELIPGSCIAGRYEVIELLGSGGMAKVYKARDLQFDRVVAVKALSTSAPDVMLRFLNEMKVHSRLHHVNIVEALDCFTDDDSGQIVFIMEYLNGVALDAIIKASGNGIHDTVEVYSLLAPILKALDYAHRQGLVHRDLKPGNIVLILRDGEVVPKVVDFGIAKVQDEMQKITKTGHVVGSPIYMSPEQCRGETLGASSDVYSLSLIAYELLSGELAYGERHPIAVMRAHCDVKRLPTPIYSRECGAFIGMPVLLNSILERAAQTDKELRFQSAGEFLKAIDFWYQSVKVGATDDAEGAAPYQLKKRPAPDTDSESETFDRLPDSDAELVDAESVSTGSGLAELWKLSDLLNVRGERDWNKVSGNTIDIPVIQSSSGKTLASRYQIQNVIGAGGMAVVYRARDVDSGKMVAAKTLKLLEPSLAERFLREIRIHSEIKHPNIVRALDYFKTPEGQVFFIMELLEGRTLDSMLDESKVVAPSDIASILAQICDALEFAHDQGIIHRDLKPDNIMLTESGGSLRVKVLDFGLAKIQDDLQKLTQSGVLIGSPAYMSPEHCLGEKLDTSSDLYSLGVLAYEMITGTLPFGEGSDIALLQSHCDPTLTPIPLSGLRADLPGVEELDRIFARLLCKEPAGRPSSVTELKEMLSSWWRNYLEAELGPSPFRVLRRRRQTKSAASDLRTSRKTSVKGASNLDSQELDNLVSQFRDEQLDSFVSKLDTERSLPRRTRETPSKAAIGTYVAVALALIIIGGGALFAFNFFSGKASQVPGATASTPGSAQKKASEFENPLSRLMKTGSENLEGSLPNAETRTSPDLPATTQAGRAQTPADVSSVMQKSRTKKSVGKIQGVGNLKSR